MTDCDLRLGRWQDVLAEVECDCLISDPPYGERTHAGQRHGRRDERYEATSILSVSGLAYSHLSESDVAEFVASWAPRVRGWMCIQTSHDLLPAWFKALEGAGRYVFAPIACVQTGMNVRLAGDGPSNWTVWMVVSRPRTMRAWGTLPGAYVGLPWDAGENAYDRSKRIVGGKPLWLMRSIIRDYSRPGDLVADAFVGGGTTLLAARMEGRRAVGAECMPEHYEIARRRLAHLPMGTERQPGLFDL